MFRVSMLLAMSCWAWIRSATPWAKAVSPRPRSVTTWPRRHRFCDRSGVRLRVQVDFKRSEEHTSELQSLMRISYAVFCLKKKKVTEQRVRTRQYDRQTSATTVH